MTFQIQCVCVWHIRKPCGACDRAECSREHVISPAKRYIIGESRVQNQAMLWPTVTIILLRNTPWLSTRLWGIHAWPWHIRQPCCPHGVVWSTSHEVRWTGSLQDGTLKAQAVHVDGSLTLPLRLLLPHCWAPLSLYLWPSEDAVTCSGFGLVLLTHHASPTINIQWIIKCHKHPCGVLPPCTQPKNSVYNKSNGLVHRTFIQLVRFPQTRSSWLDSMVKWCVENMAPNTATWEADSGCRKRYKLWTVNQTWCYFPYRATSLLFSYLRFRIRLV